MCIKTRLDFQRMAASWYPRSTNSRLPPTTPCLAERRWSHVASASTPSTSRERETRDELYKIGLPGKSILRDYFQENRTSQRPFLVLRIRFLGWPMFIQFIPAAAASHCRRRRRTRSQCRCCSCSVGGWRNRIRTADFADFVQPWNWLKLLQKQA